jgi:hypothetical protein
LCFVDAGSAVVLHAATFSDTCCDAYLDTCGVPGSTLAVLLQESKMGRALINKTKLLAEENQEMAAQLREGPAATQVRQYAAQYKGRTFLSLWLYLAIIETAWHFVALSDADLGARRRVTHPPAYAKHLLSACLYATPGGFLAASTPPNA